MARTDLHIWDRDAFYSAMMKGVVVAEPELNAVAAFAGIKVIADPRLPKGRCEVRDPEGNLLLAFNLAEE